MSGQTLFTTIYHFDGTGAPVAKTVDAGSAFLALKEGGSPVLSAAAATITPAGAATSHVLSYMLEYPLASGIAAGVAEEDWSATINGVPWSNTESTVIASGVAPALTGPLTFEWAGPSLWVTGDTYPPALFNLLANGQLVDLSAAIAIRFLSRNAWDASLGLVSGLAEGVAGQTGQAKYSWLSGDLSSQGQNLCQVRVTWVDGSITTFPDSDYGLFTEMAALANP